MPNNNYINPHLNQALYLAAINHEWNEVASLIDQGADANLLINDGIDKMALLLWVANNSQWFLVDKLIHHPNINLHATVQESENEHTGKNVLWFVAQGDQPELVEKLITLGLDIENVGLEGEYKGQTALWFALFYKNWPLAEKLIDNSPPLSTIALAHEDGVSTLWLAIKHQQWHLAAKIIARSINLEVTPNQEPTKKPILFKMIANNNWALANQLKGIPEKIITARCTYGTDYNKSVLGLAVEHDNLFWAKKLISLGADPNSELWFAAQRKDLVVAKKLIALGADDINYYLYEALKGNALNLVQTFLGLGANPSSAVVHAAEDCRWDLAKELIKLGADVNIILLEAAKYQNWGLVNELIELGASPSFVILEGEDTGKSALWFAVYHKQWDIAIKLIDQGADIMATARAGDSQGKSILWLVSISKNTTFDATKEAIREIFVNKLLAKLADKLKDAKQEILDIAPISGKYQGCTALWTALYHLDWELAKELIKLGANVNVIALDKENKGMSALFASLKYIIYWHHDPVLTEELINKCNNINATVETGEYAGYTVLSLLAISNQETLIQKLIALGANGDPIASLKEKNCSAIFLASGLKKWGLVQQLLEKGANPNVNPLEKRSLLMEACFDGQNDLVEKLIAKGADVKAITKKTGHGPEVRLQDDSYISSSSAQIFKGTSALWWTSLAGHVLLARKLIKYGASFNQENQISIENVDIMQALLKYPDEIITAIINLKIDGVDNAIFNPLKAYTSAQKQTLILWPVTMPNKQTYDRIELEKSYFDGQYNITGNIESGEIPNINKSMAQSIAAAIVEVGDKLLAMQTSHNNTPPASKRPRLGSN